MEDNSIVTNLEMEDAPRLSILASENTHEFLRYFTASMFALVVDASTLALLTSGFGVPYLISGAVSFMLGLLIIYMLSVRWVFGTRRAGGPAQEFVFFALIGIVGLGLNEGILWLLSGAWGVYYLVSKIVSVTVVFIWNFSARKYFLFSRS